MSIIEFTDVYIDIQGFRGNSNEFILKEIAILMKDKLHHMLFKQPFSKSCLVAKSRRTNDWLEDNFHGLKWDEGFIEYNEMEEILCGILPNGKDENVVFYVNGLEKQKWLAETFHLQDVRALRDHFWFDHEKFEKLLTWELPTCTLNHSICSVKNVYAMADSTTDY